MAQAAFAFGRVVKRPTHRQQQPVPPAGSTNVAVLRRCWVPALGPRSSDDRQGGCRTVVGRLARNNSRGARVSRGGRSATKMRLESSIAIHRPPEVVWAYLGDVSNLPKWDRGVARGVEAEAGVTPGAQLFAEHAATRGEGYEFHTEAHDGSCGKSADKGRMAYRVADVDTAAQRCVVDLTSRTGNARFFRRAQWIFHVTPALSGSRVTCAVDFTVRARWFFMAPLLWMTRRSIHRDLEQLKRAVEAEPSY